ncbi:hypothetical protein F4775DRAFT_515029 [Biscogniauxia sp. FL1348]|nr:hypothetical protein F4775DRAFT_515029 [Biscogniauxia sp. FL1348]
MYMRVGFFACVSFGGFMMYRTLRPSSAARSSLLQSGLQTKKNMFQFYWLSYLNRMVGGSYYWEYQCRYFFPSCGIIFFVSSSQFIALAYTGFPYNFRSWR